MGGAASMVGRLGRGVQVDGAASTVRPHRWVEPHDFACWASSVSINFCNNNNNNSHAVAHLLFSFSHS